MNYAAELFSTYFASFLLVLLRGGVFLAMLPFYGSRTVPAQLKIGLVLALALVLAPVVDVPVAADGVAVLLVREVVLGAALGFIARFVFFGVETGAHVVSTAMALGSPAVFNPEFGQTTEVARFYTLLAMLVFLATDAHHHLLYVFVESYKWVPGGEVDVRALGAVVVGVTAQMFVLALKVSAPVVVMMLVTNVVLGFIYRLAPQINIFFVGFPLYIVVGLLVMTVGVGVVVAVTDAQFGVMRDEMMEAVRAAGGE